MQYYDHADDYFKPEFLDTNKLNGAIYGVDEYINDNSYPKTRTFIIKTFEEMDSIMQNYDDLNINFDNQMLIVYTYVSIYKVQKLKIKDIKLQEKILTFKLKMNNFSFWRGNACRFYQRIIIIKLDKLDIEQALFNDPEK